tara:strand:+ start:471 stop:884 length:414 start_codon:yes stop_codon:yes gene_type:complete
MAMMSKMTLRPYVYVVKNPKVYDGDSFTCDLNLGLFMEKKKVKVRLMGVDTPEKGFRAKSAREKQLALEAKALIVDLLNNAEQVLLYSENGTGKYGRLLSTVIAVQKDGSHLSAAEELIKHNLARPYFGGTKSKEPW